MTPVELLQELKGFTEAQVKNMVYETQTSPGDAQVRRAPEVWLMRLPDAKSKTKKAPYVLLQLVSGADEQNAGEPQDSTCSIRFVVCLYADNASEGALNVADVLMCLRTALLRQRVIANRYTMRMPLEYLIYPDETTPFFIGEMMTTWELPTIKREVTL